MNESIKNNLQFIIDIIDEVRFILTNEQLKIRIKINNQKLVEYVALFL